MLYTAGADKKLALVGISLTDVYFTETDNLTGEVEYLTVGQTGGNSTHFRAATEKDEVRSMALENGYFYYYQRRSGDKYDLVRQKFGSQKTVTLLEHVRSTDYPVVYGNRLYYTDYKSGAAQAMELNMNSGAKKVMLTASGADKSGTVAAALWLSVYLFDRQKDGERRQCVPRLLHLHLCLGRQYHGLPQRKMVLLIPGSKGTKHSG